MDSYDSKLLSECSKYEEYFDHVLDGVDPKIKLDIEQRKVAVSDEDRALVIAGAGTGKTTTMIARVKYLVDIKKVDPRKILVLSYARKNVEELSEKINILLDLPVMVATFHSLGYKYLKEFFGRKNKKCVVVDNFEKEKIFAEFLREKVFVSNDKISDFVQTFLPEEKNFGWLFGKILKKNYKKYNNFQEYFEEYKRIRKSEISDIHKYVVDKMEEGVNRESPRTIVNEFVKSKGEAVIGNFLFANGISYEYERVYDELMPDFSPYRPDFTLDLGGEKVFVEYFGISDGDTISDKKYEKIRKIKEEYHKNHKTRFISLEYEPRREYLKKLEDELHRMGFQFHPRSDEEMVEMIFDNNPLAEIFKLKRMFLETIESIKASPGRENNEFVRLVREEVERRVKEGSNREILLKQYRYIRKFLEFYQSRLKGDLSGDIGLDYSDLIFYSNKYLEEINDNSLRFEHVLIDEYQDISFDRYRLIVKTLMRNNAKLMAIGDDWQSIYAFSGSKIKYTYKFLEMYPQGKLFRINYTYRSPQVLADFAGEFIMRNPSQIEKSLISEGRKIEKPIRFLDFYGKEKKESKLFEGKKLKEAILAIHERRPNDSIMVLGRKNDDFKDIIGNSELGFVDELNTKVSIKGMSDFKFDMMTIHKSKGMTADWVFLVGMDRYFPCDSRVKFWIKEIFAQKEDDEGIEYAEERRVFYVALTRTRNCVFILRNRNQKLRSVFLDELGGIIDSNEEQMFK